MIGVYDYTVILTYLSFISSLIGIYYAFNNNPFVSIICLLFSGLFDMFDGIVARTKKNRTSEEKKFGIQIDSLSDLVAFGILPSAIGISFNVDNTCLFFCLFLLPLCALIRLAFFNVDEEIRSSKTTEKRKTYLGLPVTSSAVVIPIVYLFRNIFRNFAYVYGIVLLILSILFISKFYISKLNKKGITLITIFGIIIFILILIG